MDTPIFGQMKRYKLNIIDLFDEDVSSLSHYDPNSVMHFEILPELTLG